MSEEGTDVVPLLATKLFAPQPRPDLVARPHLLARLDAGLGAARCTLVSAPAGAGKTTTVAAWLATVDRPVAWIALDERDQDVHQVVRYLTAALAPLGASSSPPLDGPPLPPEMLLTRLLNDLTAAPPGVLVLDDYHVVRAPAVHAAVAFLVEHLVPGVHLVITTREDPPLPLPRMRARGELVELRAYDLAFSVHEAAAVLAGLPLDEAQVAVLVDRTEGWAAGLQMAGLALRNRPDPAGFVAGFAGSHRLVIDYLTAEIIERQPPDVRRFLLTTAVLDRFCAGLCDAVVDTAAGGREMLERLERENLFVVPLDDDRTWYRYHRLFADVLAVRSARELGRPVLADVHRRAGDWFAGEGLLPESVCHALVAGASTAPRTGSKRSCLRCSPTPAPTRRSRAGSRSSRSRS
jgi:LuxR family maltose regulon positive regulatory protein